MTFPLASLLQFLLIGFHALRELLCALVGRKAFGVDAPFWSECLARWCCSGRVPLLVSIIFVTSRK